MAGATKTRDEWVHDSYSRSYNFVFRALAQFRQFGSIHRNSGGAK
jgi:hypothetical protein